ncbi:hypothetical protein FD25_GL002379 [Levilactobacillus acidifarinae DSM 19394]|uniref:Flavodoxin-like domain-containing protein n=1 Tax=Levilactobacillus acidifarinae DSM 19394 = JCM 15949 TaxID=1423715 RepID=A0A0R1LJD6_9LACO|nr:hypothetical protein FD25_GL002379 [Levilactobacillus acidifarinae DSM 19394]
MYYSLTGVVDRMAHEVAAKLGADLYRMTPSTTYNQNMWKAWDQAQAETAADNLPTLTGQLPDLSAYDQVILGGPVWGYTLSNPMRVYLQQTDFKGKNVAAFWTYYDHDEKYEKTLTDNLANAKYVGGLELTMSLMGNQNALETAITQWTNNLN